MSICPICAYDCESREVSIHEIGDCPIWNRRFVDGVPVPAILPPTMEQTHPEVWRENAYRERILARQRAAEMGGGAVIIVVGLGLMLVLGGFVAVVSLAAWLLS